MPLGTLNREPPPFFRQGPSALSKLAVCSAMAVLLMVADARFKVMQPLRVVVASAMYPVQWLAMRPVAAVAAVSHYFSSVNAAQTARDEAQGLRITQSQRVNQVEQLLLENERLRKLMGMRDRTQSVAHPAQVIYDAADPYTRKVVIDRGMADAIAMGSPVVDELGVVGQVTRVYPLVSEVTLLTDRDHAIPVLNTRTGARGVAFGDMTTHADAMELRYMAANADVAVGDLLTTSGVDGVYPPGLPVARIEKIERRVDTVFARIYCLPIAQLAGTGHVMVIDPITTQVPARPPVEPVGKVGRNRVSK
ncbi:MAG: rod shape-determining protein MreC [Burkholderiales bacterium PBB3]|nr:MAG: rod shape-determining protein MreC [Burkholderiales bacterium PBB3]